MIQKLMARFGYAKIPKEAVRLSIDQENFLVKLRDFQDLPKAKQVFEQRIEIQKTITNFLQSCRALG